MSEKSSFVVNWPALLLGWILPIVGVVGWVIAWLTPQVPLLPLVFYPVGLFACAVISIVIHELSHFWVARWLELTPFALIIGDGPKAVEHCFRQFKFTLNTYPYCGHVRFMLPRRRWKHLLVVLAGPLSNALLIAIASAFLLTAVRSYIHSNEIKVPSPIAQQMVLVNALILFSTLLPHKATVAGIKTNSDGMQILLIVLGKPSALTDIRLEQLSTTEPAAGSKSAADWSTIVQVIPVELMLRQYSDQLQLASLKGPERNCNLDGYITTVLMYGAFKFLPKADEYSRELVKNDPNNLSFLGSRGSVLVEMGDLEAGTAMLESVYAQSTNTNDRAISAAFLALAHFNGCKVEVARQWLERSCALDPRCAIIPRVRKLLSGR